MSLLAVSIGAKAPAAFYYFQLPLHWVGIGTLFATVLTWLIFRWRGARLKRRLNSPRLLLRDLFRLHEIGWSDRQLLLKVARRQKVKDPARLFLEPELWRTVLEAQRSDHQRLRLRALQEKLLAGAKVSVALPAGK